MDTAIEYRSLAARLRREARHEHLPNIRGQKLAAALRWEMLAEEIEMVVRPGHAAPCAGWVF